MLGGIPRRYSIKEWTDISFYVLASNSSFYNKRSRLTSFHSVCHAACIDYSPVPQQAVIRLLRFRLLEDLTASLKASQHLAVSGLKWPRGTDTCRYYSDESRGDDYIIICESKQ